MHKSIYTSHFGLSALPFENVPDPAFFFDQGDHARARNRIKNSLKAGRGLVVLIGPIGSGKTTLSQMVMADFFPEAKIIWMAEPPRTSIDLFLFIAQELALKPAVDERTFVIRDIRKTLLKINSQGGKCLVIMDESHLMSDDVINGVRILNNLEEGSSKLLQILLLGQMEMMEIINKPEFEPFRQRIATFESLDKMVPEKIRRYIDHRINVAGGRPALLTDTAWDTLNLAFRSGGTPRIINTLCDRSFTVAYEKNKKFVDAHDVFDAATSLGLSKAIFNYVLALTQKEKASASGAAEKSEASQNPAPSFTLSTKKSPAETPPLEKEEGLPVPGDQIQNEVKDIQVAFRQSLTIPLLLLLLSLGAFISSLLFYNQRGGSFNAATFLQGLISLIE